MIRDFQQLMKETYFDRDSRRGTPATLLWLMSELGEFVEAYLRSDQHAMKSEAADVLAWLSSVCNLMQIDLESASFNKYAGGCPKCHLKPCGCTTG